jgi:hypothetical protein
MKQVLFVIFAARSEIRGSKDNLGGVGSHDFNTSSTKWPISGLGSLGESGQF